MQYYGMDEDGTVVPVCDELGMRIFSMTKYRTIAVTHYTDTAGKAITVSTVFLVLDHGFLDDAPIVFETMIFGGHHDQYQTRYSTIEQARVGHFIACSVVESDISNNLTESPK